MSYSHLEIVMIILLIFVYLAFPLMLRLIGKFRYGTIQTRVISIINSVLVTLFFYLFRDIFFSYNFRIEIYFASAFIFWIINEYYIAKIKFGKKDFTKLFMILSFVISLISSFVSGILLGYLSFVLSFGGLLICKRKSYKYILYIELFFSLINICLTLMFFQTSGINVFGYGLLLSIFIFILLYLFVFKNEKQYDRKFSKQKKTIKKINLHINDKTVKKIVIVFDILVFLGVIIWVTSSANDDKYIYSCPYGYTLKGKKCYGIKRIVATYDYYCTRGTLEGSRCFTESYSNPVDVDVCPDGYHLVGFKCQKDGTHIDYDKCGSFDFTYSFLKERCYEKINPIKQKGCIYGELVGNKCVSKIYVDAEKKLACDKGYKMDGQMCEKEISIPATKRENPLYE